MQAANRLPRRDRTFTTSLTCGRASKLRQLFVHIRYLQWPRLGRPTPALRYAMYFRLCNDVTFPTLQCRREPANGLTTLLRRIGCVVSLAMAGADKRVVDARDAGAESATRHVGLYTFQRTGGDHRAAARRTTMQDEEHS